MEASELSSRYRVDLQVLLHQTAGETADWAADRYLESQPQWYAEQISQALTHLLVREVLSPEALSNATSARLRGVAALCRLGESTLRGGNRLRTEKAVEILAGTRSFYSAGLSGTVVDWPDAQAVQAAIAEAVVAIESLEAFLETKLLPNATSPIALGQRYAHKLQRRSLGAFTPETLREAAAMEVREVRELMQGEALRWQRQLGETAPEVQGEALLALAIEAMEQDRQDNAEDFLEEFRTLTFAAERFVEDKALATVPRPSTLHIALSPAHFSGAAVGGVYPSGPFAADANTLFYLPYIPDSAPAQAREGFYRSFNTHFNTMIISHEMFPGHYLQFKVASGESPAIRSLFPDGAYVEGWGSFVEELMLDAGWADNAPLTRLAHLRKRLENATRAYVSVQVHSAGWGESQVLRFAVDEGLLAPQFAQNLWQRVVHSPLQITDYFRGFRRFSRLYEARPESQALGDWVDAVLRAGPVPITTLEEMLDGAG